MNLSPLPIQKFFSNNGRPLVGGKLFTYIAGTDTKVATYTDSGGSSENTNPIILNFRGECRLWIDPQIAYKFVLSPPFDTDPPTNPIWTVDDITVAPQAFDNAAVDTGSVNNISLSIPQISSPVAFTRVVFKAAHTNTGPTTLQINGGTALDVITQSGDALGGGEISENGIYQAIFDGGNWVLQWQQKYPRTVSEASAGIVPVDYSYPTGHGRRYGMVGDNSTNDSAACEEWLQFCYSYEVEATIDSGTFLIGDVVITCAGGRIDLGFKITGSGKNVTIFRPYGSPTRLLTIQSPTPGVGGPVSIQMMMRDMSFNATSQSCDGLRLDCVASLHIDNVQFDGFNIGIDWQSALIASVYRCVISDCNIGVRTRLNGTSAGCNNISFRDCILGSCYQYACDFGNANEIKLDNCDIEANGAVAPTSTVTISNATPAVVTWANHGLSSDDPVFFTTTGALPSPLVVNQIYYAVVTGPNTFGIATVPGGADIGTSSPGSGTQTAKSPNTGGVVIRSTCINEIGYSVFAINDCWCESNEGASIRTETMPGPFGLTLSIQGGHCADRPTSSPIIVGYVRDVSIRNWLAVVGSNTANISCDNFLLENTQLINLVRPNVTTSTIIGSSFNGVSHPWGETGSTTLTLTGCTTSPTGVATWTIQGRAISINIPAITGTSNTTAASLTGLTQALTPSVNRVLPGFTQDNGVEKNSPVTIASSSTILLANGFSGTFTSSGTKGIGTSFTVNYIK